MRRTSWIVLSLVLSLTVLNPGLGVQDSKESHAQHAAAYEECARACSDCQRMCDMCAAHCAELLAQGKKDHLKTLRTCQDCATHCAAAACIVARMGPFSDTICKACEEACRRCGEECEKFKDDPMMKKCAEECRKCEKACQEMLRHVKGGKQ